MSSTKQTAETQTIPAQKPVVKVEDAEALRRRRAQIAAYI
ncbi:hypothetical protein amb2471 [Paramagnetospirillum magneticum AMB-1]|uniref:Uncharacterized protein n=1 Tax=Paramagnetospirillum magneticum (strain ATCC 700264 / AMB-1) TaxID=342108 RepID=Q2W4F0_PARM1|nr:hypothetical protein amb2471 [Paramagnetospirillum magneticum AMB-1]